MEFTQEQILLLLGAFAALTAAAAPIITTIGAAVGSWITARRAAKKDDLDLLRQDLVRVRDRVDQLENENTTLERENINLLAYIGMLRVELWKVNILVPEYEDWKKGIGLPTTPRDPNARPGVRDAD